MILTHSMQCIPPFCVFTFLLYGCVVEGFRLWGSKTIGTTIRDIDLLRENTSAPNNGHDEETRRKYKVVVVVADSDELPYLTAPMKRSTDQC